MVGKLKTMTMLAVAAVAASVALAAPAQAAEKAAFDPLAAVSATGDLAATTPSPSAAVLAARQAHPENAIPSVEVTPADPTVTSPSLKSGSNPSHIWRGKDHGFVTATNRQGTQSAYVAIDSPTAPDSYQFKITSNGQAVKLTQAGDEILVADASGKVINMITAPWALDANGIELPTSYTVSGNVVTQHVKLSATTAYPVVADPTMACDWWMCTEQLNRAETRLVAIDWGPGVAVAAGICSFAGPAGGACTIAIGTTVAVAVKAYANGQCLGMQRIIYYPGPVWPISYSGGYCR